MGSCGDSIDFLVQLSKKNCEILKSQTTASSSNWRNRLVFSEHDVLQSANVLNSEQANEMTFTNETLSLDPTVKDFLIVHEKTNMNINNALQILTSTTKPTIRNFRIVQNKRILKLCSGTDFYSIGSVIRESLITVSVNKRFGYPGRACSVIRKFRITVSSLNQVSCSFMKSAQIGRNNTSCEILTLIQRIGKSLTMHANSSIVFREIITQRRNHAC